MPGVLYGPGTFQGSPGWWADQFTALTILVDALQAAIGSGATDADVAAEAAAREAADTAEATARDAAITALATGLTENVQDIVGGMVTGNTETGIAVTYDDTAGKLNFVVSGGGFDPTVTVLEFDGTNGMMVGHGLFWEDQGVDLGACLWETWCRHDGNGYNFSEGYGGAHRVLFGWSGGSPTGNMYYVGAPGSVGSHAGLYVAEVGEWVHLAQAFDGDWMYFFVNGICVGRWAQTESRAQVGQGTAFVGGSDHQNMTGALAQFRGFEGGCGYRAANQIFVGFRPERIFGAAAANGANRAAFLADYTAPTSAIVPDSSDGFDGKRHPGVIGGSGGDISGLSPTVPPVRAADSTAPFLAQASVARVRTPPTPAAVPGGAKLFDSFGRADTIPCWVADAAVRLGNSEGGSLGALAWQGDDGHYCVFTGDAVTVRGNEPSCAYLLNTTSNFDAQVTRPAGAATYGVHITSVAFRVQDASNFLMLYLDIGPESSALPAVVRLYEVVAGSPALLASWDQPTSTWTKLRATGAGSTITAYVDDGTGGWTLLGTHATTRFQSALGVGIANYYDTGTLGRWSALAVFAGASPIAPSAPVIGTAVTAGPSSVTVPHTAASDGGSAITSTTITPYIAGVAQTPQVFTDALTSHLVTGLTLGTTYTFKVHVTNAIGVSPDSAASNTVTTAATVPGAPTIGTATAGAASATANWTAPASDGGSAITGYEVKTYQASDNSLLFTDTTGVVLTKLRSGLTAGTGVYFKVAAINAIGTGAQSATSNTVTPTAAPGFSDNFNRSNTSDLGAPYVDFGGAMVGITSNQAVITATGAGGVVCVARESSLADGVLTCDLSNVLLADYPGLAVRAIDSNNLIMVEFTGGYVYLITRVAGAYTVEGGPAATGIVDAGTAAVEVDFAADVITVKVGGVTKLTTTLAPATQAALGAATKHGFAWGYHGTPGLGTVKYDNLVVTP